MVMASSTQQLPLPSTILEVEDLEARRVLEFALELVFDREILEADCEILIKTLQSLKQSLAQAGHIAKDVQHLASLFTASNFVYVRRTCNSDFAVSFIFSASIQFSLGLPSPSCCILLSYALGVFNKESQSLKIVPVAFDKEATIPEEDEEVVIKDQEADFAEVHSPVKSYASDDGPDDWI
ncbi:hypothetical protein SO802_017861 [Lithocarpus litseifolius]|uniref:RNase H type-1 domain-containing protein n=1 Tax=Lithocarpus litseifolius TaxID=425828 RepID=A0AAW2CJL4_9ROSI